MAGVFGAAGLLVGQSPPPPPVSAREQEEPGFWEKAWDGMLGRVGDGTPLQVPLEVAESLSPGFREDFGRGLVEDPVVGVKDLAVTGVQLSPSYRLFDPAGQDRRAAQLRDTAKFAYREPGEFLKQAGGVDHIEDGQPGRFIGGWAAIFATGGAGAAVKAPAAVTRAMPGKPPAGAPKPPPPRFDGRLFVRTPDGDLVPLPERAQLQDLKTNIGDARQSLDNAGALAERLRPPSEMRHGTPPPTVTTKREAAIEAMRLAAKALEDLGG